MEIKDYKFKVGDDVITTDGRKGKIVDVCTCSSCVDRGFYEPTWIAENDNGKNYITIGTALCGFNEYYKIGEYRFNDFDKDEVLAEISLYEKSLKKLNSQLKVIEELENESYCSYCKNGTHRNIVTQYDGTFIRYVNFCDECGRDLRNIKK